MPLRQTALALLLNPDPHAKAAATLATDADALPVDTQALLAEPPGLPGRPAQPVLVAPRLLAPRPAGTREGRAALLHALTHIEFNAINLALDACWRFPGMPEAYYRDWFLVAREEAGHFCLLRDHLAALDTRYGDLPAHDGLWEMAWRTRQDVLARMALVPRTLEARGLDASPAVRQRLASAGDAAGAALIDRLLQDEIGHVAIGNRWFHHLCARQGVDPVATYAGLCVTYQAPTLPGPFNLPARQAAGFTASELSYLLPKRQASPTREANRNQTDGPSEPRPARR
ncbi:MAG: ferritin-like domain-containing protein [Rhodoferax sp.]